MSTIDTRPQAIDIFCYAGDTLTLNITSSVDYSNYVWSGHVKSSSTSNIVDTEFSFTPLVVQTGSKVVATISAEDTAGLGLVAAQATQTVRSSSTKSGSISTLAVKPVPAQYSGVWDIQVDYNGIVTTLVRGTIKVDTDVTRL